jgi:hypothetical protein
MKPFAIGLALISLPLLLQDLFAQEFTQGVGPVIVAAPYVTQYPYAFDSGHFLLYQQLFSSFLVLGRQVQCAVSPPPVRIGDIPPVIGHTLAWTAGAAGKAWPNSIVSTMKNRSATAPDDTSKSIPKTAPWQDNVADISTQETPASAVQANGKAHLPYAHGRTSKNEDPQIYAGYEYYCK